LQLNIFSFFSPSSMKVNDGWERIRMGNAPRWTRRKRKISKQARKEEILGLRAMPGTNKSTVAANKGGAHKNDWY
jgi:hypothetical protein